MEPYNFVVVRLVDNDYGHVIKRALEEGVVEYFDKKDMCPRTWKTFIVAYVIGEHMRRDALRNEELDMDAWARYEHTKTYLEENMTVLFETKRPTEDHDCGSAYLDFNLEIAYTY